MWAGNESLRTVAPLHALRTPLHPTLVVGDFSIHHPLSHPLSFHSQAELHPFFPYFSRTTDLGYNLLNTPGVYTHFPLSVTGRPSVLDLAFASPILAPFFKSWDTPLCSTGSDQVPIMILLAHPISSPPQLNPNWYRIHWPSLEPRIKQCLIPPPPNLPTRLELESWFDKHLDALLTLLKQHTPLYRLSTRAKTWWSTLLSTLRIEFHTTSRKTRTSRNPQDILAAKVSKGGYFKAIKVAKATHWKSFLADATAYLI